MELDRDEWKRAQSMFWQGRQWDGARQVEQDEPPCLEPWGWPEWSLFGALLSLSAVLGIGLGSALWLLWTAVRGML